MMTVKHNVGDDCLHIQLSVTPSVEKYPAKQHARNVAKRLPTKTGLVYLEGQRSATFEDSDMGVKFRQRRYFLYLTGCHDIPNCRVTYSIEHEKLALWNGMPRTIDECAMIYGVDSVHYTTDIASHVSSFHQSYPSAPTYIIHNHNTDIAAVIPPASINSTDLQPALNNARVIKDSYEISLIRCSNQVSTAAHTAVLKAIKFLTNEAEVEAIFVGTSIARKAKTQSYDPICGAGSNSATLHYIKNDEPLEGRQLMLVDAGAEWQGYASDVTRTFPISGKWSKEAADIYNIVENMQEECIKMAVKGANFTNVYRHAHKVAIQGLLKLGILRHGSEEEIYVAGTSKLFFPHGLGHHLGLDAHDVDGTEYTSLISSSEGPAAFPGCSSEIRLLRGPEVLQPGMVLTVEPGIYFCDIAIKPHLDHPVHSKYIDVSILDKYWTVGGVRIEDVILVTADGNENLSTALKGDAMLDVINGKA